MGAAMAPAAATTIIDFMHDTGTTADDYDLILTGDLGKWLHLLSGAYADKREHGYFKGSQ